MKKIIHPVFIFILVLTSCVFESPEKEAPEGLLSIEEMAVLLADLHIAEAYADVGRGGPDSIIQRNIDYYNYLIEKHGYDIKRVSESVEYYTANPMDMELIYEKVNEIINTQKDE